ncbi:Helix-turn-helix domain-containing protein [Chitinophaga sp. YR573]|uniref:helix-turn-helix domain-containing protein n=1 Tax=Chitinophaga sp. YR573 TaxID=1881040 RepID=UPI0008B2A6C6|nr:AraC family transcriptional regulator [Chitinophaga sp. YR573]SEW04625.1 Helix-turn-helix domain-containing protein [Chitinophaga sp. YR573]
MNNEERAAIMRFNVAPTNEPDSTVSQQLPSQYQIRTLKDAYVQYKEGPFGCYFTQEIQDSSWVFSWQSFLMKRPIRLYAIADAPMVAIIFILKGSISFDFQGHGKISLQKNRYGFYYVPPHLSNTADFITDECDLVCISFSTRFVEKFAEQHPNFKELYQHQKNSNAKAKVISIFDAGSDERKIIDAIRYCDLEGPVHKLFLETRINDLLLKYFSAQKAVEKNDSLNTDQEVKLKEIQIFIQQNIHLPLSIRSLSRQAGMNLRSFERNFKKLFSLAPREYIEFQRINEAVELLKNTNMSVGSISVHVGFAGSNYFSFVFRKHYYCSPRQYRQQWLENSEVG